MTNAFDPYHVWLGIPPAEQPPNHYRLLALAMYEGVPEVIENAADRQMAHVRRAASGKHAEHSQQILNEIAAAQRCLLCEETKQAYDAQLRALEVDAPERNGHPTARPVAPLEATMEWVPTKTAKPPAPPPPRAKSQQDGISGAVAVDDGDRWKGKRAGHASKASAPAVASKQATSPINVAAPTSVAQRTRNKQSAPWVLFSVIAALAILPVLALLVALASMTNDETNISDSDRQSPPAIARSSSDETPSTGGPALPAPGSDEGLSETPRPRPARPRPNRDPLDDTPSFGAPSGPPDLNRGLIAYWKFDQPGVQRPTIDNQQIGAPDDQQQRLPKQTTAHLAGAMPNPIAMWNNAPWLERSSGAFTFAIWIRPNSVSGSQDIAGKRDAQAPNREWHLMRAGDRVFARFHDDDADNTETYIVSPLGVLETGKWSLVVIRWDKNGDTDGNCQSLWTGASAGGSLTRANAQADINIPVTSARFGIGDDDSGVSLDGDIDEAAYWDRALTNAEVESYFNNGQGRLLPVAATATVDDESAANNGGLPNATPAEQTLTVSAKTATIPLAAFKLPPHTATGVQLQAGQKVTLLVAGQYRIGPRAEDLRGPAGLLVAIGRANSPASQFFKGSDEIKFTVEKSGELFMAVEDLLPQDNQGELTVTVVIAE